MHAIDNRFTTWDGTELFYRAWLPPHPTHKALLLFHRGHEHSGRWQEVVDALKLDDVAVFAWDARGHGQSPGDRGAAPSVMALVQDVDAFVRHLGEAHGFAPEDMVVMAHSVGAVAVAAWVHDFAPRVRGLILGAPAFRVNLYLPFAIPLLRLKQKLLGPGYVQSYVKAGLLTHDAEEAKRYKADPAIFRQIAVNVLLDLFDTSTRLLADAGAITVPTLVLSAGADWIVQLAAQQTFFSRLSSPIKEMEVYPKTYHALFHDTNRGAIIERARRFILERFVQPATSPSLLQADKAGYTRSEYDRLRGRGPASYRMVRVLMRSMGCLSRGIQLGWRHGFDSGVMLDYVYANQVQGHTPLGRLIDRNYLDSVGWRGIRQRKLNLIKMLESLGNVHVVDVACGGGRYVLESLKTTGATAELRDYRQVNLDTAQQLAAQLGVQDRVKILLGDAFDRASLQAITPRPDAVVVSGLYELFPDNEPVLNSLFGIAAAVKPGGHLIYTNQPWHPQLEFIARVLTNREGQPWIMRRRTQAEMDELVRAAGFTKVAMAIDEAGIFTVSLARRA